MREGSAGPRAHIHAYMCNLFHRATPWEISTLLSAPISIRLIQGEIITKLQHLLIGSYFNTCANPSINDIKTHKSDFFLLPTSHGRGFPICQKKREREEKREKKRKKKPLGAKQIVYAPKQPAHTLHKLKSSPGRSLEKPLQFCGKVQLKVEWITCSFPLPVSFPQVYASMCVCVSGYVPRLSPRSGH